MTAAARAGLFGGLQEFARPRADVERCELCAAGLGAPHDHLLHRESGRLQCVCLPCGGLRDGTAGWAQVRHRVQRLTDFRLTDEEWHGLGLPIGLLFFVRSSAAGREVARCPSAAGAVECELAQPAWSRIEAACPALGRLAPDVEALLVNRRGRRRDHYLVSIDECYRLVGMLRLYWRGLGGGPEVHDRIEQFFVGLDARGRQP